MEHPHAEDPRTGPHDPAPVGPGRLRRSSDRLHLLLRTVIVVGALLLVPVGITVGSSVGDHLHATSAQERADDTSVQARVEVGPAARTRRSSPDLVEVQAAWTAPTGMRHAGTVLAEPDVRVGDHLTLWIDDDGRLQPTPLEDQQIVVYAVVSGVAAGVAWLLVLVLAQIEAEWFLDRRRARQWAAGWAAVEPEWRRQVLR